MSLSTPDDLDVEPHIASHQRSALTTLLSSNQLHIELRVAVDHDLSPASARGVRRGWLWESWWIDVPIFDDPNARGEVTGIRPNSSEAIESV
jgi:hypothetical protein